MKNTFFSKVVAAAIAVVTLVSGAGLSQSAQAATTGVTYRTHVQDYGWQDWKSNGESAGTTGESKRLEGINIQLSGIDGGITYRTHVQSYGWQGWKSDGEMSGTSGESKRLEAIQIKLTGAAADIYDVYYRVHAQHFGWLDWAKNGEVSGTAGYAYRLESIQVKLVKKGESAPGKTTTPYHVARVRYQTHVQNVGWQSLVGEGIMSGTSGKSYRLEGIKIQLANRDYTGGISYRTHVQNIGWQDWVSDGNMSGTSGKSLRLEAIQIKLTGEMANHYDIYYRVHAQNFGWLNWAKNGESAGTSGYSYRLEAIQIVLVDKDGSVPGNVEGIVSARSEAYIGKNIKSVTSYKLNSDGSRGDKYSYVEYDSEGRILKIRNESGANRDFDFTYDAKGRLSEYTKYMPAAKTFTVEYDSKDRPVKIVSDDAGSIEFSYSGNTLTETQYSSEGVCTAVYTYNIETAGKLFYVHLSNYDEIPLLDGSSPLNNYLVHSKSYYDGKLVEETERDAVATPNAVVTESAIGDSTVWRHTYDKNCRYVKWETGNYILYGRDSNGFIVSEEDYDESEDKTRTVTYSNDCVYF